MTSLKYVPDWYNYTYLPTDEKTFEDFLPLFFLKLY